MISNVITRHGCVCPSTLIPSLSSLVADDIDRPRLHTRRAGPPHTTDADGGVARGGGRRHGSAQPGHLCGLSARAYDGQVHRLQGRVSGITIMRSGLGVCVVWGLGGGIVIVFEPQGQIKAGRATGSCSTNSRWQSFSGRRWRRRRSRRTRGRRGGGQR